MLLNLARLDANEFLLVSEGSNASFAEYLTVAWLEAIRQKNPQQPASILLFSYPKPCMAKFLKTSHLSDVNVKDYFSLNCSPLVDKSDVFEDITRFAHQHPHSILVINCLNTLALQVGTARACRFIEKLRQNHKSLIFCIYRRDFCQNIPRVETCADVCMALKKSPRTASENDIYYQVNVTHRKPGGTVARSNHLVCQNIQNYDLRSEKVSDTCISNVEQEKISAAETKVQSLASFRIEMSEQEMKQRNSVPLPYVLSSKSNSGESKIIYVPDDADDLDEEDPDDDLDI